MVHWRLIFHLSIDRDNENALANRQLNSLKKSIVLKVKITNL